MTDAKEQNAALDPSPVARLKALAEEAQELSEAAQAFAARPVDEKRRAQCFEEIIDVQITASLAMKSLGVSEREWDVYGGEYAKYKISRQTDRWMRDREARQETEGEA